MCRRSSPWRATDLSPDETWSTTLRGKVRGEPSGATAGVPGCCGSPHCHSSGRGTNIWQVIRQRLPCSPVPSPPLPVPARNGRKDSAALRVMDQALTGNSPPPQGQAQRSPPAGKSREGRHPAEQRSSAPPAPTLVGEERAFSRVMRYALGSLQPNPGASTLAPSLPW